MEITKAKMAQLPKQTIFKPILKQSFCGSVLVCTEIVLLILSSFIYRKNRLDKVLNLHAHCGFEYLQYHVKVSKSQKHFS
jgi:hypothetical protein